MKEIKISSPEFEHNKEIPDKFGCKGKDINPELNIEGIPEETKSLVLIMDDPDAPVGTFTHWIAWNISPGVTTIEENSKPEQAIEGLNDFGKTGYGGPCPPSGTHRYFFKIYALDKKIDLEEGAKRQELEKQMQEHIITKGELIGLYSK